MHNIFRSPIAVLTLSLASSGLAFAAESDFSAVSQQAQELLDALGSYSAAQRDEAVEATRTTLNDVDRSIDSLEKTMQERWSSMDAAAREQASANMRALRKERRELAEWYGGMKHSSGEAWEEMKAGFADAYESMSEAWNDAMKEFDSEKD